MSVVIKCRWQWLFVALTAPLAIARVSPVAAGAVGVLNDALPHEMLDDHLDTSSMPPLEEMDLWLPKVSPDGELVPKDLHPRETHLRGRRGLQSNSSDSITSPSYADEFVIPFELSWSMAFANTTDLSEQPTPEDYEGLTAATAAWLTEQINQATFNTDPFDTTDNFALERVDLSHFGASLLFPMASYPSTVRVEVSCLFRANKWSDLPSTLQFLVAFSQYFDRGRWISEYMTNPVYYSNGNDGSIFQSVSALQYSAQPSSKITATNVSPESLATLSVSLPIAFGIDVGSGTADRDPTAAELIGFSQATRAWLTSIFEKAYPVANPATGLQLKQVEGRVLAQQYTPTGKPAHTITFLMEVFVDKSAVPNQNALQMDDIVQILENDALVDTEEYRLDYLHSAEPELSLFHGATAVFLN